MGGTSDPSTYLATLSGAQPESDLQQSNIDFANKFFPQQQAPPPMGAQQPPPSLAPTPPPPPRYTLKSMLTNFLLAPITTLTHMPTPDMARQRQYEQQTQEYELNQQAQNIQSQIQLRQEQSQRVPVQDAMGNTIYLPAAQATQLLKQGLMNQGGMERVQAQGQNALTLAGVNNAAKEHIATLAAQNKTPTAVELAVGKIKGDPTATAAYDLMQGDREKLANIRTQGFLQRPLYMLQKVINPETGESQFMTGLDILAAQKQGINYIPGGALSAKDVVGVQQLQAEAQPAIQEVRKNLGAFDNPSDRAIYARILQNAGTPERGQEARWVGNILNQALKENLSPQGQSLTRANARLAETMGRLRSSLGLQATDQAMALTMNLLPNGSTPNSKYAGEQVNQLEQIINQATGIPMLRHVQGPQAPKINPGGTQTFTDGGKTYNIPLNMVGAFKKDHPNAR